MLRENLTPRKTILGGLLCGVIGGLAAWLVALGNPGNMGLCGACFLRDIAGAAGLISAYAPKIFRPEVFGIVLGALVLRVAQRKFVARSGSFAASRFMLGVCMGMGSLVFLGCPFRMLQRMGGGDLNAWVGLIGFVGGVGVAKLFEARSYSIGKTSPAPAPVGLWSLLVFGTLAGLFLVDGVLVGPGPSSTAAPAHAPWMAALGIALVAGVLLSLTGFCAVSAARQFFERRRPMLLAALLLIAGYALVAISTGRFKASFAEQPTAHSDMMANVLSLFLVGLAGALAGGCPVRQIVMAGEGNGDAFIATMGIALGGALAHNFGIASTPTGPSPFALAFLASLIALTLAYAFVVTRDQARSASAR